MTAFLLTTVDLLISLLCRLSYPFPSGGPVSSLLEDTNLALLSTEFLGMRYGCSVRVCINGGGNRLEPSNYKFAGASKSKRVPTSIFRTFGTLESLIRYSILGQGDLIVERHQCKFGLRCFSLGLPARPGG